MNEENKTSRRKFLGAVAGGTATAIAGCNGLDSGQDRQDDGLEEVDTTLEEFSEGESLGLEYQDKEVEKLAVSTEEEKTIKVADQEHILYTAWVDQGAEDAVFFSGGKTREDREVINEDYSFNLSDKEFDVDSILSEGPKGEGTVVLEYNEVVRVTDLYVEEINSEEGYALLQSSSDSDWEKKVGEGFEDTISSTEGVYDVEVGDEEIYLGQSS